MRQVFVPLLAIVIFLIFWEALVWVNDWPNYKMASPSDLWPAFWRFKGLFLSFGWETLWRTVVGLLIAIVVGVRACPRIHRSHVAPDGPALSLVVVSSRRRKRAPGESVVDKHTQ